jgi:hypothetical protein
VSVDLAVWEGPQPTSEDEAVATFDDLCRRFLDPPRTPPSKKIAEYVSALLEHFPDLIGADGDEDADYVPWGSGPLIRNASGPILYIDMKLNTAFEHGWRYYVKTATSHGLVAFDPQSGTLANPDPTVSPGREARHERRGGPVYQWFSLRSWRMARSSAASFVPPPVPLVVSPPLDLA